MAKRTVITDDGDDIPFLRGVLVESLIKTGLDFEDAFELSQMVRDNLEDDFEINRSDLAALTAKLLEKNYGVDYRIAYELCPASIPDKITVHTPTADLPFSTGILAADLESHGIDHESALQAARIIFTQLTTDGYQEIDHTDLNVLIYRCLRDNFSQKAANIFLSWQQFEDSGKSLILLIGGITGVGKSTVSHELGYKLDIPQVQSTDMIRQIIRAYLAPPLVPMLQYSSFEAWKAIPSVGSARGLFKKTVPVVEGFLSQLAILQPALQASVDRAIHEQHHIIIEGVHILPTEIDLSAVQANAIIVPVMLANTNKKTIKKQLTRRGLEQPSRSSDRYVDSLEYIWTLQSFLLKTADKAGIPIIPNRSINHTVSSIIDLISQNVSKQFLPEIYQERWDQHKLSPPNNQ